MSNYPPGVTGNEPQITGEWPCLKCGGAGYKNRFTVYGEDEWSEEFNSILDQLQVVDYEEFENAQGFTEHYADVLALDCCVHCKGSGIASEECCDECGSIYITVRSVTGYQTVHGTDATVDMATCLECGNEMEW